MITMLLWACQTSATLETSDTGTDPSDTAEPAPTCDPGLLSLSPDAVTLASGQWTYVAVEGTGSVCALASTEPWLRCTLANAGQATCDDGGDPLTSPAPIDGSQTLCASVEPGHADLSGQTAACEVTTGEAVLVLTVAVP